MTASPTSPALALLHCRDVTRRRARNFYYGLKLLPEPQRSALYAVYAWMRRADDLTDAAGVDAADARARIEAFREATVAALRGDSGCVPPDDPVLVGLRVAAETHRIDPAHFHAMLDGQLDDLDGRLYATFEDLRGYCERVASSVGLVCIEIWGYDDAAAPALARERGIAFQLTNILRDFLEDIEAGRVYLPAEDFVRCGLTAETLRHWTDPPCARRFLLEQIERCEEFYRRSRPLDEMITPACRPTLWAMTTIYHRLLGRMRADPAQIVRGPRIRLSSVAKGAIALRAKWRARMAVQPPATRAEAGAGEA